ncbi:unnamed protein product [Scytosiphon promiscuus]
MCAPFVQSQMGPHDPCFMCVPESIVSSWPRALLAVHDVCPKPRRDASSSSDKIQQQWPFASFSFRHQCSQTQQSGVNAAAKPNVHGCRVDVVRNV